MVQSLTPTAPESPTNSTDDDDIEIETPLPEPAKQPEQDLSPIGPGDVVQIVEGGHSGIVAVASDRVDEDSIRCVLVIPNQPTVRFRVKERNLVRVGRVVPNRNQRIQEAQPTAPPTRSLKDAMDEANIKMVEKEINQKKLLEQMR